MIGLALSISWGAVGPIQAQSSQLPTCTGWSNCGREPADDPHPPVCRFEEYPSYFGPTIVSDFADGLSSDGRGPYTEGADGVAGSFVFDGSAGLSLRYNPDSVKRPRTMTVNLNHPVPGGGGVPLGIITVDNDELLYTALKVEGGLGRSLLGIPIGQTVTAGQMNVGLHVNGHPHVLQMGPQPLGVCHSSLTRVNGTGTSSATISRPNQSTWVIELPAGSVGRLFDLSHTTLYAEDKGLYSIRLRYQITNAVPGAGWVLRTVAESQDGAAVVARYRALKRDSATAYHFSPADLNSAADWLRAHKKPSDAAIVYRLSVAEYPDALGSVNGLGKSYLALGDTSNAIATYRKYLERNPQNEYAANALKHLGVTP
jgi:hypothetical protein